MQRFTPGYNRVYKTDLLHFYWKCVTISATFSTDFDIKYQCAFQWRLHFKSWKQSANKISALVFNCFHTIKRHLKNKFTGNLDLLTWKPCSDYHNNLSFWMLSCVFGLSDSAICGPFVVTAAPGSVVLFSLMQWCLSRFVTLGLCCSIYSRLLRGKDMSVWQGVNTNLNTINVHLNGFAKPSDM